jgi:hypothetical protein
MNPVWDGNSALGLLCRTATWKRPLVKNSYSRFPWYLKALNTKHSASSDSRWEPGTGGCAKAESENGSCCWMIAAQEHPSDVCHDRLFQDDALVGNIKVSAWGKDFHHLLQPFFESDEANNFQRKVRGCGSTIPQAIVVVCEMASDYTLAWDD